jgi:hypothetical protein
MCDKELIVGYLYDELTAADRRAFEDHVAVCAECRIDVEELRTTRTHLALWAPPEPELGFRVIRGGAAPAPVLPRRNRFVPAFAFAAAAVIVLAAAAAIANLEVSYGNVSIRTGWARGGDQPQLAPGALDDATDGAAPRAAASSEFAALERRLQEIESALRAAPAAGVQTASASGLSDADLLRRVRQMISEAEDRQETAFARRLLQVVTDLDNARRADLALIQQGLGQYQGLTNAEIAQNRDMLNQFIRAATRQEK